MLKPRSHQDSKIRYGENTPAGCIPGQDRRQAKTVVKTLAGAATQHPMAKAKAQGYRSRAALN